MFARKSQYHIMVAMGYGGSQAEAGQKTRYTADGGVDGIIKEDKLGLDSIYIQAKRSTSTVGRPVVQEFAGSLEGFRARKGVLITTSTFSKDAREYVDRIEKKIVLIDGPQLAQLMIDHNVGVTTQNTYVLKRVDGDYFEEE
jgi:restriction system protein